MLCHPCIHGVPQTKGDQIKNGPPHPGLLGGAKEGGNAMLPLHFREFPTKGTKSEGKSYARGNNDAPSISKHGPPVRANTQIVALR